jgi:tRNA modification GTPase
VIVILESSLEFVEDDLPAVQAENVRSRLQSIRNRISEIASTFKSGRLIREGLKIAIVGRPNVGKSSLFNSLLGTDRAIVTDIPGTTRDQLHERFVINNIPVSLIDTAGLRETGDIVESIGVERSRRTMADADIVLVLIDVSEKITDQDLDILRSVGVLEHIVALNKIDKVSSGGVDRFRNELNSAFSLSGTVLLLLSAKTGEGLEDLKKAIIQTFTPTDFSTDGYLVSDARHHDLLTRAAAEIDQSLQLSGRNVSEEIILIGLHNAMRYLGQITGETTTEDMLTRIFSTFCIGK